MKRGDIVATRLRPDVTTGLILRVASDGSWADVEWCGVIDKRIKVWSKRMPTKSLLVKR